MDQFYVQLDRLDDIGKTRLPGIAASMTAAGARLEEAIGWITRTFDTEGRSYDQGRWDAEQPYQSYLFWRPGNECFYAMDFMRRIVDDNRENVELAAQAVREMALRYRQADGQA
ncbi:hypothetical protein [Actinophytocola glycyrrhizae]|uniref:Uncharacterized protein n=1 Tax=Actinophytocola glycyrrhizae TaxID=2044873 RepID=A0ABV9S5A4_9PSEU